MAGPRRSRSLESMGSQHRDALLILSEGGTVRWLILQAKRRPLFILSELASMKPVTIRVMRRCITWRKKWNDYVDVFIAELK
nr:hypothetical protein CFP56_30321 [Quercus suber]